MTQQYMAPSRTKRPAARLVAGLLWLAAAGLAVGATFADIVIYEFGGGVSLFVVGFWRQYGLTADGVNSPGSIYYGAAEVGGAALLLLATLLVFLRVRRSAAVAAGAFGTGMLVTATLTWLLTALSRQADTKITIQPGLWVLTGATAVALAAFLVSLAERATPEPQPYYDPPTPPNATPPLAPQPAGVPQPFGPQGAVPPGAAPQARWEPETPKYGIPVEQPAPQEEPAPTPERVAVSPEEDVFVEAFDHPEFTTNGTRKPSPQTPEPGTISRKLDGDEK